MLRGCKLLSYSRPTTAGHIRAPNYLLEKNNSGLPEPAVTARSKGMSGSLGALSHQVPRRVGFRKGSGLRRTGSQGVVRVEKPVVMRMGTDISGQWGYHAYAEGCLTVLGHLLRGVLLCLVLQMSEVRGSGLL